MAKDLCVMYDIKPGSPVGHYVGTIKRENSFARIEASSELHDSHYVLFYKSNDHKFNEWRVFGVGEARGIEEMREADRRLYEKVRASFQDLDVDDQTRHAGKDEENLEATVS